MVVQEIEKMKVLKHEFIVSYIGADLQENTTSMTLRIFQERQQNVSVTSVRIDEIIIKRYAERILNALNYLQKHKVCHRGSTKICTAFFFEY